MDPQTLFTAILFILDEFAAKGRFQTCRPVKEGEYWYFTNGYIMIRTKENMSEFEIDDPPFRGYEPGKYSAFPWKMPDNLEPLDLEVPKEAPETTHTKMVKCDVCGGSGVHDCYACGYTGQCFNCDGLGLEEVETGPEQIKYRGIPGRLVDRQQLDRILYKFGVCFAAPHELDDQQVVLRFGKCEAIFMCMKDSDGFPW